MMGIRTYTAIFPAGAHRPTAWVAVLEVKGRRVAYAPQTGCLYPRMTRAEAVLVLLDMRDARRAGRCSLTVGRTVA